MPQTTPMAQRLDQTAPISAKEPHRLLPVPWAVWFWNQGRKIVVLVTGMTVLVAGIVMLVIPGPGLLGIVAGLAILGTEFAWARWVLKHAKERASQLVEAAQAQINGRTVTKPPDSTGN